MASTIIIVLHSNLLDTVTGLDFSSYDDMLSRYGPALVGGKN